MPVPQITCPNCGRTITLENRREIDQDLIKQAAQKGRTTFTELLHATRLPRKTLSVRLKEMCEKGILAKQEGAYMLNGTVGFDKNGGHLMRGVSRMLSDRKIRTGLMLVAFLLSSSVSGYVLASLMAIRPVDEGPQIIGTITMNLNVRKVADFCAWQVLVTYDPDQFKVMSVVPGEFVGADPWSLDKGIFAKNMDLEGRLLLGGSLIAIESGRNGDGTLATITFGYYTEGFAAPEVADTVETYWMNSLQQIVRFTLDETLVLG